MKFFLKIASSVLILWILSLDVFARPVHELVASFGAQPQKPSAGKLLLAPDGHFWGATEEGGIYGAGALYRVKADGSDWEVVLSFAGTGVLNDAPLYLYSERVGEKKSVAQVSSSDGLALIKGRRPNAGLVSDGAGWLWGTTAAGGKHDYGTVFKVNVSSKKLITMAEFTGEGLKNRGRIPQAGLTRDETGLLWGATADSIFKINATTGELTTLAELKGPSAVGGNVHGALLSDGLGFLWGTTHGKSSVFKINAATGALNTVIWFSGTGADNRGYEPCGQLLNDGAGFLWGTTFQGASNQGTVFKVKMATGELTTVVEFKGKGRTNKSGYSTAGLTNDGAGNFWGVTNGDMNFPGSVFKVNAVTEELTTVMEFPMPNLLNGGRASNSELVNDGAGSLWGTTAQNGSRGKGTVYKIDVRTGIVTTVVDFAKRGSSHGCAPNGGLVGDKEGFLWGSTRDGGANGYGTLFKVNPGTGVLMTVVDFTGNGSANKGALPSPDMLDVGDGFLWGTTAQGGSGDFGTIFKVNVRTGKLITVMEWPHSDAINPARYPTAGLVNDGVGFLWGTTGGTVFKINFKTEEFIIVRQLHAALGRLSDHEGGSSYQFEKNDGINPNARLMNDGEGYLWGTAQLGGRYLGGTVFKMNISSGELTTMINFKENSLIGEVPSSELVSDAEGNLWGTTSKNGDAGQGIIFKINTHTGAWRVVNFPVQLRSPLCNRFRPLAGLTRDGKGNLWGTTSGGGNDRCGIVFKVDPMTSELTTEMEFTGTGKQAKCGAMPYLGSLYKHTDGNLYGATTAGGPEGGGTLFRIRFGPTPVTLATSELSASGVTLTGRVNANGAATTAQFEYGLTMTSLTYCTRAKTFAATAESAVLTSPVGWLTPGTTYYYRLRADNTEEEIPQYGEILSFTTDKSGVSVMTASIIGVLLLVFLVIVYWESGPDIYEVGGDSSQGARSRGVDDERA